MEAKLKVIDGAKGAVIRLKLPTTIGRGSESSLKVPQSEVSRSHCEIYEEDGLLAVNDLGSSNGTFVNDEPIDSPTFLYPGDILRVGSVALAAIYKADSSLVPDNVADQDADTGVTAADAKAVTAKAKKESANEKTVVEEPVVEEVVVEEVVKEEPVVAEEVAPDEEAEASGLDLDEVLGTDASEDMFEEVAEEPAAEPKPTPTSKPTPAPKAATAAKKPVAKKKAPAKKAPAKKAPAKKIAAVGAAAAGVVAAKAVAATEKPAAKKPAAKPPAKKVAAPAAKEEDSSGSSVSAIVDYEENDGGSFIAIQAIETGDETPGAEVSSFALDVGETDAPSAVSGFSLDTGDEAQSAIEVAEFSVGDEEGSEGDAVDGGDSALNDFFKNLE